MAEVILMPRLSDTMTEGVIAEWHKKVGDTVKKGDLLADIETDKATMELESYQNGTILYLGGDKGAKIQVNDLLAIVGKPDEDVTELINSHGNGNEKKSSEKPAENKQDSPKQDAPAKEAPQSESSGKNVKEEVKPAKPQVDYSKAEEVVLMPRLSDTMTEGVIASWQKKVGDEVKKGDVLAEIETDKATMELESYKEGTLLYQGGKVGDKVKVNDLLCIIGDKNKTDVDAIVAGLQGQQQSPADATPKTEADLQKAEGNVAPENPEVTEAKESARPQGKQAEGEPEPVNSGERIFASPLARRLAEENDIDLRYVKGTADNGRIVKSDIEKYIAEGKQAPKAAAQQSAAAEPQAAAPQPKAAQPKATESNFEEVPVSQMRKTIARRLAESKFSAPHFYLTMKIDMDGAVASREKLNQISKVKISFNDMVIKAVATALRQHPQVNSSWQGETIRRNHQINIGVAVAVEEGLLVPVVRNADQKSLSQIASEVKGFAQKAKDKKLQPSDWEGNTFTVSNLGMFGIDEFTAIINSPDACILAVGGITDEAVVKNGAIVPGKVMKITLSCDHRVVDGATGAAFLQTLKGLLEEPLSMLV